MEIKAVKFRRDGFYTQPFVFGGEEGPEKYDKNIRYRGSLQNYLIDAGSEVILVDTGIPAGTPEEVPDENSKIFTGKDICTYMEAFAALGYKPEQVTKILLTHRHADHSGELRSFPNAKVYVNKDEMDAAEYENKLSVVYDDLPAARETLDRVREFVRNHPTVYCSTHSPQGYENLETKRVMDLDNPVPTILAEVDFSQQEASGKYVCSVCGYVYDPAEHDGVAFEDLPDDWRCPRCKQPKEKFNKA